MRQVKYSSGYMCKTNTGSECVSPIVSLDRLLSKNAFSTFPRTCLVLGAVDFTVVLY